MKQLHFLILLIAFVSACKEEDELPSDQLSTKIGKYVYQVIEGNKQEGVPGQYLEKEIKIVVLNNEGRIVRRPFDFMVNDQTSETYFDEFYASGDTLFLAWKLGCEIVEQELTIVDNYVCDAFGTNCSEENIFTLQATANKKFESGWFSVCYPPNIDKSTSHFSTDNDRVIFGTSDQILSLSDVSSSTWDFVSTPEDYFYNSLQVMSSGEILSIDSDGAAIISKNGESSFRLAIPSFSSSTVIEALGNGYYFYIKEHQNILYRSTDGNNWEEYVNVDMITNYEGRTLQGLSSYGSKLFVVTINNYVVEIDSDTDEVIVHKFNLNDWPEDGSLSQFNMVALGKTIFMRYSNFGSDHRAIILSLNDDSIRTFDLSFWYDFHRSNDEVYLLESLTSVYRWTENDSSFHSYDLPKYYTNNSLAGMYNGQPIGQDDNGSVVYFFE